MRCNFGRLELVGKDVGRRISCGQPLQRGLLDLNKTMCEINPSSKEKVVNALEEHAMDVDWL